MIFMAGAIWGIGRQEGLLASPPGPVDAIYA
jgi:hypothetical protein